MLNVKKADGKQVDFSNIEDLAQLFLEMVPDRVMRSLLFDTRLDREVTAESVDLGGYEIIKTMKRIINVAYIIVLTRWKQLNDNKEWGEAGDVKYFENSRFTKLFQSALSGEDITLDLQIFSLLELWVDLKEARGMVCNEFSMIFDSMLTGNSIGVVLQSARDAVKNATFKRGGDQGKFTQLYCNELCYQLLRAFMVFGGATVSYPEDNRTGDDRDFAISYKRTFTQSIVLYPNTVFSSGKFIASEEQILLLNGKTEVSAPRRLTLYMRTETSAFDGKYQNRYSSIDGERQTFLQTDIIKETPKSESYMRDIHETRKFLSFSYKNIREFAMILNDSIKEEQAKRRELFKFCQDHYPKIVADIKSYDAPNIYWDNIITLMLLEMGVSDFLERILCEEQLFSKVLDNIAWRYKGRNALSDLHKEYRESIDRIAMKKNRSNSISLKQEVHLRVKIVLKAMNFNTEDDDNRNAFLDSLSYKYGNILTCIEQLTKNEKFSVMTSSANDLQKIFSDIFMFLQIFYTGLDSYAEKQIELNESFSAELSGTSDRTLSEGNADDAEKARKKRLKIRHLCFDAFEQAAKAKLNEIKDQSLTQLFDGFCEMCESYNTFSADGEFSISEQAKRLKHIITRNYICDAKKLRRFATVVTQSGEETTIFEVLGNLQKYQPDPQFNEWLTYLKDVFMFLIYNEDYNKPGLWRSDEAIKDKDCDPIYPYIVTYYKENIDRDNVKKCAYRVPLPIAGVENEGYIVTLLTDEEYMPTTYYCIPLRYGSSDSWWINPFLIPKKVIKKIGYPEPKNKQ
ncbi:MAG: hypothetical protein K2O04_03070 [Clostridiales bacterium]|nr:hypothetical protein [Clostridiales bacterium]